MQTSLDRASQNIVLSTNNAAHESNAKMSDIKNSTTGDTTAASEDLASLSIKDDGLANAKGSEPEGIDPENEQGSSNGEEEEGQQGEDNDEDDNGGECDENGGYSDCEKEEDSEWSGDEDLLHDSYCPICLKTAKLAVCRGCKDIAYCSKTCQKKDWTVHKVLCSKLQPFSATARPSDKHYRAILFPAHGDDASTTAKPRFVWLKNFNAGDPAAYESYFPPKGLFDSVQCDCGMGREGKKISTQPVRVICGVEDWLDPKLRKRNSCLDDMIGGKAIARAWLGNVLIVGHRGNITLRDFRAAVDYLQCNGGNLALVDPSRYLRPLHPAHVGVLTIPDPHLDDPMAEPQVRLASLTFQSEFCLAPTPSPALPCTLTSCYHPVVVVACYHNELD